MHENYFKLTFGELFLLPSADRGFLEAVATIRKTEKDAREGNILSDTLSLLALFADEIESALNLQAGTKQLLRKISCS
jgi:hypothetical protein